MIINTKSWHYKIFLKIWKMSKGPVEVVNPPTLIEYLFWHLSTTSIFFGLFCIFSFIAGGVTIAVIGTVTGDAQRVLNIFEPDPLSVTSHVIGFISVIITGIPTIWIGRKIYLKICKIIDKISAIKVEYK